VEGLFHFLEGRLTSREQAKGFSAPGKEPPVVGELSIGRFLPSGSFGVVCPVGGVRVETDESSPIIDDDGDGTGCPRLPVELIEKGDDLFPERGRDHRAPDIELPYHLDSLSRVAHGKRDA
jgi:hypothetical protein